MSQPERVSVRCPHCQGAVGVPTALLGKTVHCPRPACKKPFALALPAAPAPSPAAPGHAAPTLAAAAVPAAAGRRWPVVAVAAGGGVLAVTLVVVAVVGFSGSGKNSKEPLVAAAAPPPGAPAGLPPPSEYIALAQAISNQYALNVARPTKLQAGPEVADLTAIMKKLAAAKNPVVAAAVAKLEEGRQRALKAVHGVQKTADAAQKNLEEVLEKAARGDYAYEVLPSYPGGPKRMVDESRLPVFGASVLNLWVQQNAPGQMKYRAAAAMEGARLEAWNEIVPKLASIYAGSPVAKKLVNFRITAPDPKVGRKPAFAAINPGNRTLTNVTLALDLVHFTTAPEATSYQVYFIPRWEAGQEIHLPAACVRNRRTEEYAKGRPVAADPGYGDPRPARGSLPRRGMVDNRLVPGATRKNPWLASLGGLVEVRCTLWAPEAHLLAQVIPFPEQAEAGARWDMKFATHMIRLLADRGNLRPDADKGWAGRAARRILAYAPPGSDVVRQARLLLEDPQALVRQITAQETEAFTVLTTPGTICVGDWKVDIKEFGSGTPGANRLIGIPVDVRNALQRAAREGGGKIALHILTCDRASGTITAALYDPAQPKIKRQLTGAMKKHTATGRPMLAFEGTGERPSFRAEHLHPMTSPRGFLLVLEGAGLSGTCPGYPYSGSYGLVLDLKVSVAGAPDTVAGVPDKATSKERSAEAVKALLALTEPGTAYKGTWLLRVGRYSPGRYRNIHAAIHIRKNKGGTFLLRIDARDSATRAVTATLSDPNRPKLTRQLKGVIMDEQAIGNPVLIFQGAKVPGEPSGRQIDKAFLDFFTAPGDIAFRAADGKLAGKLPGPLYPECFWFELKCE
jgi:hypothetical protein